MTANAIGYGVQYAFRRRYPPINYLAECPQPRVATSVGSVERTRQIPLRAKYLCGFVQKIGLRGHFHAHAGMALCWWRVIGSDPSPEQRINQHAPSCRKSHFSMSSADPAVLLRRLKPTQNSTAIARPHKCRPVAIVSTHREWNRSTAVADGSESASITCTIRCTFRILNDRFGAFVFGGSRRVI
jgi:hypothetical protein